MPIEQYVELDPVPHVDRFFIARPYGVDTDVLYCRWSLVRKVLPMGNWSIEYDKDVFSLVLWSK